MPDDQKLGKAFRAFADVLDPPLVVDPTPDSPTPPTPSTPTPPVVTPVGITDSKLKLVWQDEMSGTWPDLTNWRQGEREKADGNHYPPGYPVTGNDTDKKAAEKQFYNNSQVTRKNGFMYVTADRRVTQVQKVPEGDSRKGKLLKQAGDKVQPDIFYWPYYEGLFEYVSGWASTGPDQWGVVNQSWQFTNSLHHWKYGYFETSLKMPKGQGYWPAWWFLRTDKANKQEIDGFEMVDKAAKKLALHYHPADGSDWTQVTGPGVDTTIDLSADFNTYAVDWTPDYVRWILNGKVLQEYTDKTKIPDSEMYMIFNLAVGGNWPGDPISSTPFPQSMVVDYVRVWQRQ